MLLSLRISMIHHLKYLRSATAVSLYPPSKDQLRSHHVNQRLRMRQLQAMECVWTIEFTLSIGKTANTSQGKHQKTLIESTSLNVRF